MAAGEVTRQVLAEYEAGGLITRCAWCGRIEIDGEWLLAPRAALTAIDAPYTLSHSICPSCAEAPPGKPPALA
jgi:hypothetical protein